jgi:ribulose bisphosphate carboxylase small subunit
MSRIIITDLTRFKKPIDVCTAGTDMDTGKCIRPMPYLKMTDCVRLGILPGAILSGDFTPMTGLRGPHQEDASHRNLNFLEPCTSEQFEWALRAGLQQSIEKGFEIQLAQGQKHVPTNHPVLRSIITVEVDPKSIAIVEDGYNPGKVKVHFVDSTGRQFRYMAITDLGFFRYAESHRATDALANLNAFVARQPKAYLRIGLGRVHKVGDKTGFWMQVNGIYTFPDFFRDIRSYR